MVLFLYLECIEPQKTVKMNAQNCSKKAKIATYRFFCFHQNLTHMGRFDGELSKLCFSYNTFSQKLFTIPSRKKLWRLLRNKLIYWLYLNKFLVFKYLVIDVTSVGLNYCCHTPWHLFVVIFPATTEWFVSKPWGQLSWKFFLPFQNDFRLFMRLQLLNG